ncbi:MAG: TRAP transporter fused permease subunit [Rhizobiales bacterium]|nr:TRAP transporter fused permease subunit [Hyphomicrobiales bacterium]
MPASAASRAVALWTDIFQGLLIAVVVLWVLDVPRRVLGLAFYTEQFLAVCLGLSLALAYIGSQTRPPKWYDWTAAFASLGICLYITLRYHQLTYEIALLPTEGIIGSAILILAVLEATRRTSGGVLVIIILVLVAYVFIGPHLPADFQTRPVSPERLLVYLGLDLNGMIGAILAVAVVIVIPFTLMGQVLGRTGGAAYFADLAMAGMGHFRGGAAKIAVAGSALFGMISGAVVSNVVAVGIVTIPLMARSGFSAKKAAAIESVGSTGGQLMPPVMGAAAFIMAEFLQVSYGTVVIAAIIPSVLYYAALFMHVDLEAAKERIGAAQVDDVPPFSEVVTSGWHFPIPIIFLVLTIAYPEIFQIPIERAAVYSTGILIVLCLMFGYRGRRVTVGEMTRAVLDTGRAALDIVLIGAAAGLVVGTLSVSGISFGLTLQLIAISGENLFVLLVLTAVISIILGMGMPTVSVYVLTATLLAPSLVKLGVTPMAAHMYVMYFGMLSMITPPVAIAAYAAANIARVSGWQTGWTAVAVGWSTFFIPFLFVLEPALLMEGPWYGIVWQFARNMLGIFVGTSAIVGYAFSPLSSPLRICFAVAALAVLIPPNSFAGAGTLDWFGLAACLGLLGYSFTLRLSKRAVVSLSPERRGPA